MSYICYLDLIGIKELASYKPARYSEAMNRFTIALFESIKEVKAKQKIQTEEFQAYFFSDCAFIEARDILALFLFIKRFRYNLVAQDPGFYFTAAIGVGADKGLDAFSICGDMKKNKAGGTELDALLKDGVAEHVKGTVFLSNEISAVYLQQNRFKGIGIYVDQGLRDAVKGKVREKIQSQLSRGFFFPGQSYDKIEAYDDIMLEESELDSVFLTRFIDRYHIANKKQRKYGKYYFSLLVNIINSSSLSSAIHADLKTDDKHVVSPEFTGFPDIYNILLDIEEPIVEELYNEATHFELIYFYMFHKAAAVKNNDVYLFKAFVYTIINIPPCRKHINNIDAIPNEIFTLSDKELFLRHYREVIKHAKDAQEEAKKRKEEGKEQRAKEKRESDFSAVLSKAKKLDKRIEGYVKEMKEIRERQPKTEEDKRAEKLIEDATVVKTKAQLQVREIEKLSAGIPTDKKITAVEHEFKKLQELEGEGKALVLEMHQLFFEE